MSHHHHYPGQRHPKYARLLKGVIFGIGLTSLIVNILVLLLVVRMKKEFHRLGFKLIAAVAIIDAIYGTSNVIEYIAKSLLGHRYIFKSPWFCPVFNLISLLCVFVSGFLMALVAVDRFFLVCRNKEFPPRVALAIIVSAVTVYSIPAFATSIQNAFSPDPLKAYCVPYGSHWATACNVLIIIGLLLPLFMVTFSYSAITIKVCRSKMGGITSNINSKVAIKSITMIIIYAICFLPKFITVSGYTVFISEDMPDALDILSPIGVSMLAIVNPFLILFLHSQFRKEVRNLFHSQSSIKPDPREARCHSRTTV